MCESLEADTGLRMSEGNGLLSRDGSCSCRDQSLANRILQVIDIDRPIPASNAERIVNFIFFFLRLLAVFLAKIS